jgi:hypothetical protein
MPCRKLTCATCVAGALIMIVSVAKAADGAKYPDWEGAWERWYPANAVLDSGNGIYTAGGQPSFVLKVYSDELHWKILGRWLRWATRRRAVPAGARC